ncbi:hypothetical protein ACFPRL_27825 [Pseudoclavibacter helvolus]
MDRVFEIVAVVVEVLNAGILLGLEVLWQLTSCAPSPRSPRSRTPSSWGSSLSSGRS